MTDDEVKMYEQFLQSSNNRQSEISVFGNRNTIIQVVTLLSYIRHAIRNNLQCDINVSIGKNVSNREFEFTVNNEKTDDLITKESIEIN